MQSTSVTGTYVILLIVTILSFSSLALAEPIEMLSGHKQLFLDDYAVQEMSGLTRKMHRPEKKGAVIKPDIPSDDYRIASMDNKAMWVEKEQVYKFVYMALPRNESDIGPALAISKDGLHWEKPNLGQGLEVRGSTDNNRLFVDRKPLHWPDDSLLGGVIYDPDDPDPTRRYKGLIGAIGRCPVVSPDVINWRTLDVPQIPSSDTSSIMYDRPRRRYVMFGKTSAKFGRSASVSISKDFEHWSEPVLCFATDEEDQKMAKQIIRKRLADPGLAHPMFVDPDPDTGWTPAKGVVNQPTWRAECYVFTAFPYEGVYIGMAMLYYPTGTELPRRDNTDGFHRIQLLMSRDLNLTKWTRLGNRQAFISTSRIDNGLIGVFDRMQMFAGEPVKKGDELWFYYTGYKTREYAMFALNPDGSPRDPKTLTPFEKADREDGFAAICLATLRLDGFVSLDAAGSGYVLTKPMTVAGEIPYLNIDASRGQAKVEVLNEKGDVIPGFSKEECRAITADGVRQQVAWQTGGEFSNLVGKTAMFKIYLTNASLYAFGTDFPCD